MATLHNVELFRTGTQTDSQGRRRVWTPEELQRIAGQYDPNRQEAPAVIGHPKETAPAYGWVSKVWVEGDTLKGDFAQVAPEFVEALKSGRYKKRSISVDKNLRLRHVAFLGAALPAVEGLKDIEFSVSAELETYEFTANEGRTPKEEGMNLEQALAEIERLKDEIKKLKDGDKDKEAADKLKAAEDEAREARKELADFKQAQSDKALEGRIDALIKEDKLLPGDKEKTLNFARAMADESATMDFSKDGQNEKVTPREAYLRDLESNPVLGTLSEFARRTNDSGSNFSQSQGDDDAIDLAAKM
ncbi:hypothetical protein [Maridesulfovibrio bastinii]|uniref:hypothetical protein n=1 Tax=Maridesulfovibrio bastinii TaxID=47157 RepID=UPI0003FB0F8E|nr:hypothetical protein [Maridesulfovibrio bastinii]